MPGFRDLLRRGARGLRQRPPDPGPAEHRRRLVHARHGRVAGSHGSTNNTFHVNGQPFGNRTAAFDSGVLQAETLAQAAERGGKKVAQIEWAGGRGGAIEGPTLDFRNFRSGRGVATNYISPTDSASFTRRSASSSTTPPGSPATRRSRRPRPRPPPVGPTFRSRTAPLRRCGCACSTPASTSTA